MGMRVWKPESVGEQPRFLRVFVRTWLLWAGRAGSRKARRIYTRSSNPHGSALPFGSGGTENLRWDAARGVIVIDLDAMTQYASAAAHARAWRRDRARLLANWPPESGLHRWLDEHLPPEAESWLDPLARTGACV
jgi:hypothetical protein